MIVSIACAKNNGDIICVRPDDWQWGKEEINHFLIIKVDLGKEINTIEDTRKLEVPLFETKDLWWPSDNEATPMPKIVEKRRYKIPLADIDTIVKQMEQPIEKIVFPVANLITNKATDKKLTTTDFQAINLIGK